MPTYEYECTRCDHSFEVFHSISAEPPKRCPKCRAKVRRRIGTGGGLLFKGSGFYITDYRSDNYKKASKSEQSSAEKKAEPAAKQPASAAKKPES